MSKTMAEHARAYRTRKAEKMARMEAALREIAYMRPAGDVEKCANARDLVRRMEEIAIKAL